ncbi:MAG: TraR/DksA C4-type zinc finger protein [Paracoccaceae bacterium]|nr:TraR/DksA C4-type zinc finger protein [Paracoccaceae bacterium]
MPDLAAAKTLLKNRRAELLGELHTIEDALDDPVPKDWEDAAVERQGDEVLHALGDHDKAEIRQIDAALGRIEEGSYGQCTKCGNDISPERLAALPATPFCKSCA